MRKNITHGFWSTMLVVAAFSSQMKDDERHKWDGVVEAIVAQSPQDTIACKVKSSINSNETLEALRKHKPRYVAFVVHPDELNANVVRHLKRIVCSVDDDPFEDAIWGIVTGPTPEDAIRVGTSKEPSNISSVLATTGVGQDIVSGPVTVISDANPPGEWWSKDASGNVVKKSTQGDTSHVFVDAWAKTDPQLLLTSSHASERNLEMPFSRGNIVPHKGAFGAVEKMSLIDYRTGQATGKKVDASKIKMLEKPNREKVWLAAGNCLIANHKEGDDMIMTALGFGKVNQFVGYIKTTWYGEIGWNSWRYFGSYKYPLNESWYAANQLLIKKLIVDNSAKSERDKMGLIWDFDGTAFYGNPRRKIALSGNSISAASKEGDLPLLIVFADSKPSRRLVSAPQGFKVFVADDFALVTEWPELQPSWRDSLQFE